ncbi:MAG: class I SAM-dependent methyltransferase [Dehalococcoidia bacterium]|nr:class I SAM-dependent methyltransferase [Dehalococcoidia bacterium]
MTPDTSIESLNLNWRERDLPQSLRTKHVHALHPYLGKFVPQLVEIFLRKYRPEHVLDPFAGCGTTLVEATAFGVPSVGTDISAFNCLLTSVKTHRYDLAALEQEVVGALDEAFSSDQFRFMEGRAEYKRKSYLTEWFAPEALAALTQYRLAIRGKKYEDVLKVILSRAARSARLTTHFDLDFPKRPQIEPYYCYKHSRTCSPTRDARRFLERYSIDALRRIRQYAEVRRDVESRIECADARSFQYPEADLVITSPPYVGLIDYHEQHRYAYELLGIEDQSDAEIGAAKRGVSQGAQAAYVDDMVAVFRNVASSLSPSARVVVIVHDRRNLYHGIAQRAGFRIEHELRRLVDRRTGRRATQFHESVFVWRAV